MSTNTRGSRKDRHKADETENDLRERFCLNIVERNRLVRAAEAARLRGVSTNTIRRQLGRLGRRDSVTKASAIGLATSSRWPIPPPPENENPLDAVKAGAKGISFVWPRSEGSPPLERRSNYVGHCFLTLRRRLFQGPGPIRPLH